MPHCNFPQISDDLRAIALWKCNMNMVQHLRTMMNMHWLVGKFLERFRLAGIGWDARREVPAAGNVHGKV